ncbi:putative membrane protein YuaF [Sporomusa rhizae]|uniref:NfeD family protein n=1 Tax=Sporomusa rhizae TaxID=357999 RepID=UPI00352A51B1
MLEVYWGCLIFGVMVACVTVLFGDVLGHANDGFLQIFPLDHLEWLEPAVVVGGITVFGGTGIILTSYTELVNSEIIIMALSAAVVLSVFVYFFYIKPMKKCENSSGFFIKELVGKTAEVIVPIPANGYGEIIIKIGAGITNQIAVSSDKTAMSAGTKVVVTDIKEGILYVASYNKNEGGKV